MTDVPRTAHPWYEREITELRERAETAERENERHRRANLVRAVAEGYDPDADEWIREAINAEDWDAVPWRIAENLGAEVRRLRDLLTRCGAHIQVLGYGTDDEALLAAIDAELAATEEPE